MMSKVLNTVIIDDEPLAVSNLAMLLEQFKEVNVVGTAHDKTQAVKLITELKPQLVFLDINLLNASGFDVLDELDTRHFDVVFATAHNEYALKAFEYYATNYVLKPIDEESIAHVLSGLSTKHKREPIELTEIVKLMSSYETFDSPKKIALHTGQGVLIKPIDKIEHLESSGNYTYVYFTDGLKEIVSKTMREIENQLADHEFYRINHGLCINCHEITFYNHKAGKVTLKSNQVFQVSHRKRSGFLTYLKDNMNMVFS